MNKFQAELDNRIYAFRQKELCVEAAELATKADIAFLQDREEEAELFIYQAEAVQDMFECAGLCLVDGCNEKDELAGYCTEHFIKDHSI